MLLVLRSTYTVLTSRTTNSKSFFTAFYKVKHLIGSHLAIEGLLWIKMMSAVKMHLLLTNVELLE